MLIAGIDIGGTSVKIGAVDEMGQVLARAKIPSIHGDAPALAAAIAACVAGMGMPFAAAGVGTAGRVDQQRGTVTASNLDWTDVPLHRLLEEALGLPVYIDNDAQAALLAESQQGACRGMTDVLYLTLGTGIGGAFLIDGKPYRGHDNTGAEVGHMLIRAGGIPCACGQRGCWERYAAASALEAAAKEIGLDVPTLFERAEAGEPGAAACMDAYLDALCDGIISLNRMLAPQMIVFGGGLSNLGEAFLARLARVLAGRTQAMRVWTGPQLRLAQARNGAGILGGAAIARYGMGQSGLGDSL